MDSAHNEAMSDGSFSDWALEWIRIAKYPGATLPNVDGLINQIVKLWDQPIPGDCWRRGQDSRLLDPSRRYCRGNSAADAKRRGEHKIEYELLHPNPDKREMRVFGARLVDGVNAVPLAKDATGGRVGNVEADMLLLVQDLDGRHHLELIEVKDTADNAWFASVENLRQLRLLTESAETRRLFTERRPDLALPPDLPYVGLVLAPPAFFSGRGKKGNAVAPAQKLLDQMRAAAGVEIRLATWESTAIEPLGRPRGRARRTS
jgi:hypothetical protein